MGWTERERERRGEGTKGLARIVNGRVRGRGIMNRDEGRKGKGE